MSQPSGVYQGAALRRVTDALRDTGIQFAQSGTHIQASCPVHGDDRKASLSIDQRGDHVVGWCHTCQLTGRDLADALGLPLSQWWDNAGGPCVVCGKETIPSPDTAELVHDYCARRRGGHAAGPVVRPLTTRTRRAPARLGRLPARLLRVDKPRIRRAGPERQIATYEHVTADGEVVGRSVRVEFDYRIVGDPDGALHRDKRFYQEHPVPGSPTGWARGLDGDVPLWRATEVAEAVSRGVQVWLAEGHKDAERLERERLVATTNISGALNFHAHHVDQLRDAEVVVCLDRDDAGWRRGIKIADLLSGVARSVRFALPAVDEPHADVTDHLDAGHSLAELVEVAVTDLRRWVLVHDIETRAGVIPAEIAARLNAATASAEITAEPSADTTTETTTEATTGATAEVENTRAAQRWAVEAGQLLLQLRTGRDQLAGTDPADTPHSSLAEVDQLLRRVEQITLDAHHAVGLVLADEVASVIAETTDAAPGNTADAPDAVADNGSGSVVVHLPEAKPDLRPEYPIPVTGRGEWAYSLGEGNTPAGVYHRRNVTQLWVFMSLMPHVQARLVRRDAGDRRTATDYLIGLTEEGAHVVVDARGLGDGRWINQLGEASNFDPTVAHAVGTAIAAYAHDRVDEHEATPRVSDDGNGLITMPPHLPSGWLELSPAGQDRALDAWRDIVANATPVMAHLLAASAFSPFLRSLGMQSHVFALSGSAGRGKTLTLRMGAAVWGNSLHDAQNDLYSNWSSSAQGLPTVLGGTRLLPAFRDEAGMAGLTPEKWGVLLTMIADGVSRTRASRESGHVRTPSWQGIVFSTGNGEMREASASGGAFAGLARRVLEFAYDTFTPSESFALRMMTGRTGLLNDCYGHLGKLILDTFTVDRVYRLVEQAERELPPPDSPLARTMRQFLIGHIAGAMMVDELLGTGQSVTRATTDHVADFLADLPNLTDGDRVLDVLLESIAGTPNAWPTKDEYEALNLPFDPSGSGTRMPVSGINAGDVLGVRVDDDRDEVWAFTEKFRGLCGSLNVSTGLRELETRGVFYRTAQKRTSQELRTQRTLGKHKPNFYIFRLRDIARHSNVTTGLQGPSGDIPTDDTAGSGAATQPVITGNEDAVTGSVTGEITGTNTALTRSITGITGKSDESTCSAGAREEEPTLMNDHTTDPTADTGPHGQPSQPGHGVGSGDAHLDQPMAHTAETTAGWGADEFDAAVTAAFDRGDWAAAEQLETLMDEHERAFRQRREQRAARRPAPDPAPDEASAPPAATPPTRPATVPATVPTAAGRSGTADDGPVSDRSSVDPATDASPPRSPATVGIVPAAAARGTGPRFVAPAAVLDATRLYLPAGQTHNWRAEHLGHLAVLVHERDGLRLGAGGGVGRLPAQGQLWLLAGALETLGLPEQLRLPDEVLTRDERRRAVTELFATLTDHPMVAGARAEGWEIKLDAWTRIRHPELLPAGAFIVFVPWQRLEDVPLLETSRPVTADTSGTAAGANRLVVADAPGAGDQPISGAVLVDRLAALSDRLDGVPYIIAPNATGMALIDHTRPPRRTDDEPVDHFPAGPGRRPAKAPYRLQRNTPPDIPGFLRDRSDARFTNLEHDWRWWRTHTADPRKAHAALTDAERRRTFVVGYDRGGSHLSGWRTPLGCEGLRHHDRSVADGGTAGWNGKDEPGLYRVKRWDTPHWGLPDPLLGCGAQVRDDATGEDTVWVTTPTLMQLRLLGVDADVVESYTWDVTSRYLDLAVDVIKAARTDPDPAMVKMIKNIYTTTAGKFAQRDGNPNYHLARPDWWFHIVAKARFGILNTLCKINTRTGELPIAVSADAIFYTTDDPDPITAWPGDPTAAGTRLGTDIGHWKPIGTARLDQWAPKHLVDEPAGATFRYAKAVDDLTPPDPDWLTTVPDPATKIATKVATAKAGRTPAGGAGWQGR